jgi:hypothetical protein
MDKAPTVGVTRVEAQQVQQLTIHSVGLDPIRVVIDQFGEGQQGMITITCYGRAWTAYWGAMATRSVREFFVSCDVPYLVGCLVRGMTPTAKRFVASDEAYIARIVASVQQVFRAATPAFYTAAPVGMPDDWPAVVSDAIKVLDDVAQFHGQLPVGMYRNIRPRLAAMRAAAPQPGVSHA